MPLRDTLGSALARNRFVAALELLIVPLLLLLQAFGVLRNPTVPLFFFGWLSLWLRRNGWRQIGMARPTFWMVTILAGITIGVAYNAFDLRVLLPILQRLTGEPLDVAQFNSLRGNFGALLLLLVLIWPLAAFGEEMAYRGYVLNRLADVFGWTAPSWIPNVILVSLAFGFAHRSQGVTGILDNVLAGLLFSALYLVSGRNLWLPILVHGVVDTSSLVLLYLGIQV